MIQRAAAFTVAEVAHATAGEVLGPTSALLAGVATDTRDALAGQLFVALRGPNHDAHHFLEAAVDAGAAGLLVARGALSPARAAALSARAAVVAVDDTLVGLGALAQHHRRRLGTPRVVALTGSNGKTSTKELLAAVLGTRLRTRKTEGNLNNLVGLPLTLLSLAEGDEAAVLELGMNAPGEIARMVALAEPDVALVVNVGPAHVGELGSIEAVARAKGELYAGAPAAATIVVNADDARVVAQAAASGRAGRRTFGRAAGADVRLVETHVAGEGQALVLEVDGARLEAYVPYPGAHNALNAAAAVAAATAAEPTLTLAELASGLAAAPRVKGRLMEQAVGPWRVVDDAYNANTASTVAALDTLAERRGAGRLVALLGEMRELGAFAPAEHAAVGAHAARVGAALVAAFGPDAAPVAEAARAGGVEARHEASDAEALWRWVEPRLAPGDLVLVKGSRGIRMEQFLDRLRAAAGGSR